MHMITISEFKYDSNFRELLPMNSEEFPYACIYSEFDKYVDRTAPWHWHSIFEIDYALEGDFEVNIPNQKITLPQGHALFINSNVLHETHPVNHKTGCKLYAHQFDMNFLSGSYSGIIEKKYFLPILKSGSLLTYQIQPDSYTNIRMLEHLLHAIELCRDEPFGFELDIRSQLSEFWKLLYQSTEVIRSQSTDMSFADTDRLKLMMQYIHTHYMEKLTLEEIASAANISVRECSRCFNRCINESPVHYLNAYRLRMATRMLLSSQESILTIGENCGFSSGSYFSKVFFETMGCTPGEYRKRL